MKPRIRLLCCLGGLLGVLAALFWPHVRHVFQAADALHDPVGSLKEFQRQSDELEAQRERLLRWRERKREVVHAVIAGELTLLQAATRFRQLDQQQPDFHWDMFRQTYPGRSDAERHCRHVIVFVEAELCRRPREAEIVVARLEAELREHLHRHGRVILPE